MNLQEAAIAFLIHPPTLSDLNAILMQNWFPIAVVGTLLLFLISRLQPKHFYFVRHGRTLLNEAEVRQGEEGGLSNTGRMQADMAGLYLSQFHIQEICSSTYQRARETAEAINAHTKNVPVTYSQLLVERRNPKEIIGKNVHDPDVEYIVGRMDQSFHDDALRISDEENFIDLKKRAVLCLNFLEHRGPHEICVVTHHAFLQMLMSYMLHGKNLHADDFAKLSFFNPSENAGISVCTYSPWKRYTKSRGWTIVSYNETFMGPQV